jgi:hypothetical protein
MIVIDSPAFHAGHRAFLLKMERESGGIPFTNFAHRYFQADEVRYKQRAVGLASEALQLSKWPSWLQRGELGRIVAAVRVASAVTVSSNLLEHRFGNEKGPMSPLYRARGSLERQLGVEIFNFFLGGSMDQDSMGPRFDRLATFFRDHRLGCHWPFLAYLAFLADSERYFPIHPGRFERLLYFYGIQKPIAGHVSWERYLVLLDLADELRRRLAIYGEGDAIKIQSYMYVVARRVEEGLDVPPMPAPIDPAAEIERRVAEARERERIGLLGETLVLDSEKARLRAARREDLAARVVWVAEQDCSAGYDVLSFDDAGLERHLEVKSTTRSAAADQGFWLSANELHQARTDTAWRIIRVSSLDDRHVISDLGNPFTSPEAIAVLQPASYFWALGSSVAAA